MCKLAYGQKPIGNEEIDQKILEILRMQFETMTDEKDGASAMIIKANNEPLKMSSTLDYNKVFSFLVENLPQAKFFGVHTRRGTHGDISLLNCHFFEDEGLHFAHNGIVSAFSYWGNKSYHSDDYGLYYKGGKKVRKAKDEGGIIDCEDCNFSDNPPRYCEKHLEEEMTALGNQKERIGNIQMCDSYQFLHAIRAKLNKYGISSELIADAMNALSFTGLAVMVDTRKGKNNVYTLISSSKDAFMVTDDANYYIAFSYKPVVSGTLTNTSTGDFGGISYTKKVETQKITLDVETYPIIPGFCYVNKL